MKQAPEAFAVSLGAAMRTMCAAATPQPDSTHPSDTTAATAAADGEFKVTCSPAVLVLVARMLAGVALDVTASAALPTVQIGASSAGSSSCSSEQQLALLEGNLALSLHVPHVVSLLLSSLKSAVALRSAAPRLALSVASCIAGCRVQTPAADWLHAPRDPPKAALQEIRSMSVDQFRDRLEQLQRRLDLPRATAHLGTIIQLPDANLKLMMAVLPDEELQLLLAPPAPPRVGASTRRIGHCGIAEQVVGQGFFTFQPGGINSRSVVGSSASGNVLWYNKQIANACIPWLTVAARSMWLMGQTLSELLPGGSSSSSSGCGSGSSVHSAEMAEVDVAFFRELLESTFACCEWIGSQLSHMHLPGDADPLDGSSSSKLIYNSSSSGGSHVPEGSMPLLQQLLDQHAQLQYGLFNALQQCVADPGPPAVIHDIQSAAGVSLLQRM
jgi:hypothetical protein